MPASLDDSIATLYKCDVTLQMTIGIWLLGGVLWWSLMSFGSSWWLVSIITCVLRTVYIRKVWCIFENFQLMKTHPYSSPIPSPIKWSSEQAITVHPFSLNFIIFWARIKVELGIRIKRNPKLASSPVSASSFILTSKRNLKLVH